MQDEVGKKSSKIAIGVLAYQGGVEEHYSHLSKIKGVHPVLIEYPSQLNDVSGLIIPGGESTTLFNLMKKSGMDKSIRSFALLGKPIWGTCAGLIVLSSKILSEPYIPLGLIDIEVQRNAYGSQLDSFITQAKIEAVSEKRVELIFIRAPRIAGVGSGVDVLAEHEGFPIFVRQKNVMVTSFHPELSKGLAFHRYFVAMVQTGV